MKSSSVGMLILLLVVLMVALPGYAQVDYATATLRGTVYDPQGAVVPGASVTVTNSAKGVSKLAKTGTDGSYQIPALNPGTYQVEVGAQGFAKAVAKDVALAVGQIVVYDVHLAMGSPATTVVVESLPPLIQSEQTQQANSIDENQVENLPNISRSFTQSLYTVPGVVYSNGPTIQDPNVGTGYLSSGFSIGGSNGRNNLVTIDGGENDYGSGALRVTNVPIDSVQEFQVNRNSFQAEFGFTIGSAINMVTKSGTNRFHGSAYTYFHDQATDAVNFFNKLQNPNSTPFEQSVISGGTLGGPIKKDKLFFFTSYEHQKLDQTYIQNLAGQAEFQPLSAQTNGYNGANPVTNQCPNQTTAPQQVSQRCYLTQLANSGQSFAGTAGFFLKSTIFSPLGNPANSIPAHPILNALVAPNDGAFDGIANALGAPRGIPGFNTPRGRYNNWVSRIDYLPSSKDSLFLRFSFMDEPSNAAPQPPASTFQHNRDYTITTSWTRSISPTLVHVVRVQVVPQSAVVDQTPANLLGPCGITGGNLTGGCRSQIQIGNQIVLGNPFAFPYSADWKRFQFDDSVSWLKGAHNFKFGGSYRPDYYDVFEQLWLGGAWSFPDGTIPTIALFPRSQQGALAAYNLSAGYPALGPPSTNLTGAQEYVAGLPIVLLQASPTANSEWKAWAHYLGLYAQDSWKVSRKLTLNYGVRVDYDHAPSSVPSSVYGSPRLGIAFDPRGDGKTVIRAGGGLFVAPVLFLVPFYTNLLGNSGNYINQGGVIAPNPTIFAAWFVQTLAATTTNPNPALSPAQLASVGAGAILNPFGPTGVGSVFFTLGPNFKPEYSVQASLSVAREIAHNLSLEIGYNMYRSVHIEQNVESNYVRNTAIPVNPFVGPFYMPKPGVTTNQLGASESNLLILQNNAFSSVGSGIYHALTASLTKRYGHGLQFQANYTFSRAIDNTSDYSSLSTPFRPDLLRADRSASLFNITHSFVANAVYNTPFKAGQGNLLSTLFADVSISPIVSARSGFPFTLLVPGLQNGAGGHNNEARPFNEPRNAAIGPDLITWDMRVSKAIYIRRDSGLRLDLIAQATNLLNRTNFAAVNNNFPADPTFALPNGGTLGSGPYAGIRGFVPTKPSQLSTPLAFTQAYPPRQVSFALQLAF